MTESGRVLMNERISAFGRIFECRHALGAIVYHVTRDNPIKGVITDIVLGADGGHYYRVRWGDDTGSDCYDAELTKRRPDPYAIV